MVARSVGKRRPYDDLSIGYNLTGCASPAVNLWPAGDGFFLRTITHDSAAAPLAACRHAATLLSAPQQFARVRLAPRRPPAAGRAPSSHAVLPKSCAIHLRCGCSQLMAEMTAPTSRQGPRRVAPLDLLRLRLCAARCGPSWPARPPRAPPSHPPRTRCKRALQSPRARKRGAQGAGEALRVGERAAGRYGRSAAAVAASAELMPSVCGAARSGLSPST